jgi:hypothetical protein
MKGATVNPNGSGAGALVSGASTPMTASKSKTKTTTKKSDISTQAADALASLKQVTANLTIDDAIPPNQLAATKVSNRVPLAALTIAAGILQNDPKQFPQFDGADAQAAIDYEQQMVPVGQAALVLSKRIAKSVLKRRSNMAHQTLALYQVMKGTSRLSTDEGTRTQVQQLKKLFTLNPRSRATDVTQAETKKLVKTAKSARKQAVAQAKAADANNAATIATAQATLEAAVAAGTVSQFVAAVTAPPAPAAPPAAPAASVATVSAAPTTAAPATITPSH